MKARILVFWATVSVNKLRITFLQIFLATTTGSVTLCKDSQLMGFALEKRELAECGLFREFFGYFY